MTPLLRVSGISKSFSGVTALSDVSLELLAGEVHALVGENGAGKSTLIKIITGAHSADAGTLEIEGRPIGHHTPMLARRRGIAAIYQQPALFPDLTVAENLALGFETGGSFSLIGWSRRRQRARELLGRIGARIDPDAQAGSLTMPEQQMVEIAKSLGGLAKILIMDEPTASLPEHEVKNLFRVIRELKAQGVGILYISHRLEELYALADRVTVLRDGRTVTTRPMSAIERPELIRLMVGRELSAIFPKRSVRQGEVAIELSGVGCRESGVHGVSLNVRAGEIVGLAGLVGAGRTELARILFGLTPATEGEIRRAGRPVQIRTPARAIELGIAYLPEDRRRHGVILEMSVAENATLAVLDRLTQRGLLDFSRERALAEDYALKLSVKTPSVGTPVGHLSGGNQQKVALARWLASEPGVIILDEPTQGIDVGAKSEIHRLMGDLAERGMAILMISSELPEILGMSDRIAVMREGTIAGVLEAGEATPERVMSLALGHAREALV